MDVLNDNYKAKPKLCLLQITESNPVANYKE